MADFLLCQCKPDCSRKPTKGARYANGHRPKPVLKLCACGECEKMVKGIWAHGHYARKNNPSLLAGVKVKRSISSKKRIADGERSFAGWNSGLSKESDERVAAYGAKNSELLQADEVRLQKRTDSCKKQWDEGSIVPRFGAETSNWKGGVSNLQQRSRTALYHKWSRPIMIRDGFKCKRCQDQVGGNLVVHHDTERFATILSKIVAGRDVSAMTFEEQGCLVDDIIKYHLDNGVHGITLCRPCHDAVHEIDPGVD